MIKIIEHRETGETKVLAFDHQPYSANRVGVPPTVFDAALQGLGQNVLEFDCRVFEWSDEITVVFPQLRGTHAHWRHQRA